jgi:hypothetical protein
MIETESLENFDFKKDTYVIHKFNSEIDNIDELKSFYIHHKHKLFDNCGIFFVLKDYFNLDKAEDDDNQKINNISFKVDITLPDKSNRLNILLEDRGRSWISVYGQNSKYDCRFIANIDWAIKTIEPFSEEERNDRFMQRANYLKLFKASYEYIDNVFLKKGNNVLGISGKSYDNACNFIRDEIMKLELKRGIINSLATDYGIKY